MCAKTDEIEVTPGMVAAAETELDRIIGERDLFAFHQLNSEMMRRILAAALSKRGPEPV